MEHEEALNLKCGKVGLRNAREFKTNFTKYFLEERIWTKGNSKIILKKIDRKLEGSEWIKTRERSIENPMTSWRLR